MKKKEPEKKPRVLFFDIETLPNLAYVWGKYEQNVIAYKKEWEMLCFAYRWMGQKHIHFERRVGKDDYSLAVSLHKLFMQADILVAHNGDSFDIRKVNARFIFHKLKRPKIKQSIDTKKIIKKHFALNSNGLDDACAHFKLGRKVNTGGFDLWLGCMKEDKKCWKLMRKYNMRDVRLLEKLYMRVRPWIDNHPNIALIQENGLCPNCGSDRVVRAGIRANHRSLQQQWHCNKDCGAWFLTAYKKPKEF